MKQLQGTIYKYECDEDILGRITFNKNRLNRKDWILVCTKMPRFENGFNAILTSDRQCKVKNQTVCVIDDINEFHEGDVITLNKYGLISFVYEIEAHHNAIFTTAKCNHRCIMCPQPPVLQEIDRTPFNLKLISLIDKNVEEIGITGGEPTMIGDKLFELVNQIKKYHPYAGLNILSNGVMFSNKEYAKKLALCHYRDLQIDIPIFSDIASLHNYIVGANTFYQTVRGLYNLALFHQRIGLRIVVHRQTYKRLPQLANYIYHNFPFVVQVAFLQMETIGLAEKNINDLWIDPYEYNEELRQAIHILSVRNMNPVIYNAQLCVLPEDLRDYAQQSITDWKDIYISECEGCALRNRCGGLFASNEQRHSKYIHKIEYKDNINV